ncbi:MAG TPA: hypothetical protein VJL88_02120 [Nitrospira sp.]|nr:hypothetical protein [Nitrospira sp.]
MRRMIGLLTVVLTGCHGLMFVDVPQERNPQIMPLWEQYQRCQAATDPDELIRIVDHIDTVTITGVMPPAWLNGWGPHVRPQPVRATVDPRAIGAACTLRAAAAAASTDRVADARALYERVLIHYAGRDWAYYTAQAREALARLSELHPTIAASLVLPHKSLPR